MKAERWQQIEGIFQFALERESGERAVYLDEACGGDEALRQEVESLLAAYEKTGSFMNVPAHEVAARLLAADGSGLQEGRQDDSTKLPVAPDTWTLGEDHQAQNTKLVISRRRRIILVGLFFSLMFVYVGVRVLLNCTFLCNYASDFEWKAGQRGGRAVVISVNLNLAVSQLRVGDEIVAVNGARFDDGKLYVAIEREILPLKPEHCHESFLGVGL